MRRSLSMAALAIGALAVSSRASAQVAVGGYSIEQLDPAPAGDTLFGVPGTTVGGHLVPRAMIMFDYAHEPLRLISGASGAAKTAIVDKQGFLRLDASLALWDRLLVSVDVPFALLQGGEDPHASGVSFNPPSSAALGDLRLGARGRLVGDDSDPFQLAVGGYLFLPTGPAGSYSGEGAVRGDVHAVVGGAIQRPVHLVYSGAIGAMIRGSGNPHSLTFGGGVAGLFAHDRVQIGPEVYGATLLGGDSPLQASGAMIRADATTNVEGLLGVRVRMLDAIVAGVAFGPGLTTAIGTPRFRAVAMLGWVPQPGADKAGKKPFQDRDDDGIADDVDACPNEKGGLYGDPSRDGCPAPDKDKDGVMDSDDACPTVPGARSADALKNGCPLDGDDDGVADKDDACPKEKGVATKDPKTNGCPVDSDGDGVADNVDACPNEKGDKSTDPRRNGCLADPDGDGVLYPDDACPNEKGLPDKDPQQNGCPKYVRVTDKELVIKKQVEFIEYGKTKSQTVDPVSDDLMKEVRDVINQHPEILRIEVQGHTDDSGDPRFNNHLSQERADAVRQWLIDAGIAKDKLVAKGYGSTVPIGDNRIRTGRQQNRRVQFLIVQKK